MSILRCISPEFEQCRVINPTEEAAHGRSGRRTEIRHVTHFHSVEEDPDGDSPERLNQEINRVIDTENGQIERPKDSRLQQVNSLVGAYAAEVDGTQCLQNIVAESR